MRANVTFVILLPIYKNSGFSLDVPVRQALVCLAMDTPNLIQSSDSTLITPTAGNTPDTPPAAPPPNAVTPAGTTPTVAATASAATAITVSEAQEMPITAEQRTAIAMLTVGNSLVAAARAAGVSRMTLYRWLKDDLCFRATYNAWQQDTLVTARGRLLGLADAAVTAVANAVHGGDHKLALRLLERMDIARPAKPGSANVEDVERKEHIRRVKQEAKFYDEQNRAELTKLLCRPPNFPARKKHDQDEDDGEKRRNQDGGG